MVTTTAWIGARYRECGRVLVLLESTWGDPDATQRRDVELFCAGGDDATFYRMHDVLGKGMSRRELFDQLACANLVEKCIGETNKTKVRRQQLNAGAATLMDRLRLLQPNVVWIASKKAAPFAAPVVKAYGARVVMTPHPLYAVNISDAE